MSKRGISVRTLCKIATVAHNRAFKPSELAQYTGVPVGTTSSLVRRGILRKVSGGTYYPTAKGWKVIDRACNMAHGR